MTRRISVIDNVTTLLRENFINKSKNVWVRTILEKNFDTFFPDPDLFAINNHIKSKFNTLRYTNVAIQTELSNNDPHYIHQVASKEQHLFPS